MQNRLKVLAGLANHYKNRVELLPISGVTNITPKPSSHIYARLWSVIKTCILDSLSSPFPHNFNMLQFAFLLLNPASVTAMCSITHTLLFIFSSWEKQQPQMISLLGNVGTWDSKKHFWNLSLQSWRSLFLWQKHLPLPAPYLGRTYWEQILSQINIYTMHVQCKQLIHSFGNVSAQAAASHLLEGKDGSFIYVTELQALPKPPCLALQEKLKPKM